MLRYATFATFEGASSVTSQVSTKSIVCGRMGGCLATISAIANGTEHTRSRKRVFRSQHHPSVSVPPMPNDANSPGPPSQACSM